MDYLRSSSPVDVRGSVLLGGHTLSLLEGIDSKDRQRVMRYIAGANRKHDAYASKMTQIAKDYVEFCNSSLDNHDKAAASERVSLRESMFDDLRGLKRSRCACALYRGHVKELYIPKHVKITPILEGIKEIETVLSAHKDKLGRLGPISTVLYRVYLFFIEIGDRMKLGELNQVKTRLEPEYSKIKALMDSTNTGVEKIDVKIKELSTELSQKLKEFDAAVAKEKADLESEVEYQLGEAERELLSDHEEFVSNLVCGRDRIIYEIKSAMWLASMPTQDVSDQRWDGCEA
jgi:hypothetical protein